MTASIHSKPTNFSPLVKPSTIVQQIEALLPQGFFLVKTAEELARIKAFKQSYYTADRPNVHAFHDDGLDKYSYVLYGTNYHGELTSTSRLLLDDGQGFPEDALFPDSVAQMRRDNKRIAELGRLLITQDKVNGLRTHYRLTHAIANLLGIDYVLIVMKQRNIPSHKKMMAVEVLSMNMGYSWDEEQAPLCLIAWDMKAAQPKFHKWVSSKKTPFTLQQWDHYSSAHLSAYLSVQKEVYQQVVQRIRGQVLDLGCGTGRIMAYVQDNPQVNSYTGVDASTAMIQQAKWLKTQLGFEAAALINADISDIQGQYDSIFSIHSFYSWSEQDKLLKHIYTLLKPDGIFILVNPNASFNEERLAHLAKQELIGHPHYNSFMESNYAITAQAKAQGRYLSLDKLIEQVRRAKFVVKTAHDQFFLGGASYLELGKAS